MRVHSCAIPRRAALVGLGLLSIVVGSSRIAAAQTPYFPYFLKNNVRYDNFEWHIYATDHFEVFYYPELEQHLERIVGYLESAYQHISSELRHDLPDKTQVIFFKTHSEFEQQNVAPGQSLEGVGAFVESIRDRMLLPIDDAPDRLYGLIVHELTHVFENNIIPQGLMSRGVPLWVMEGLSDYMRAEWVPIDLMQIRDAAVSDNVPRMSTLEGYGGGGPSRLIYNLGHAVFEFIEERFGKEGLRGFLFALRKSVIGGSSGAYEEAFAMTDEEFDIAFDRHLKDRFKPFRDKERPADYGRDLSPDPERGGAFTEALAIAPSPSGDLLAVVTFNMKDGELDVVLISARDGDLVHNLTPGFNQDLGFSHIVQMGVDRFAMPWISWSPRGDRVAYFVRTGKERTLIVQDVQTRDISFRVPLPSVDEPESPSFSPDGQTVVFSALRGAVGDIFRVDLATGDIANLTNDEFNNYGPVYSRDGSYVLYSTRISGNQKLFRLDLASGQKRQITFGTHDDMAPQFLSDDLIVFTSTATNPAVPLPPEVDRNGKTFNIWTLDLSTGALKQYTDALGGNVSPVVLNEADGQRIAFVSYYKGNYGIHKLDRGEAIAEAATADFGSAGPIVDFQAPLTHTLIPTNARKKKTLEKMFLDGRPPVNLGVTSNGDFFGATQVTFSDVLGDKQFTAYADSLQQYRTLAFSYTNIARRLQYSLQAYTQTRFFYAYGANTIYDPIVSPLVGRDDAQATRTARGVSAVGIYPMNRFRRLEFSASFVNLEESYNDPDLQAYYDAVTPDSVFRNGTLMPIGVAFVSETTVFREFGPLAGNTMRVAFDASPDLGPMLSRQTFDVDARHYQRIATTGVLALRFRGFKSWGEYPDYLYFGGNSEMRGYDYLDFVGQNVAFANAELRFPIIEAALTPIGIVGGIRGVLFANMGGGWFDNATYKFFANDREQVTPIVDYERDALGAIILDPSTNLPIPVYGPPISVDGFRLRDGRASYGVGLETFVLGFPMHFDWAWRTTFNREWEDVMFLGQGGSDGFRSVQFAFWMGYDF